MLQSLVISAILQTKVPSIAHDRRLCTGPASRRCNRCSCVGHSASAASLHGV